jgi:N-acetylmuramoyl-L-alanine amidase
MLDICIHRLVMVKEDSYYEAEPYTIKLASTGIRNGNVNLKKMKTRRTQQCYLVILPIRHFILIAFVSFIFAFPTSGQSPSTLALHDFCQEYGFLWQYHPAENIVELKKTNLNIKLLLNSRLITINNQWAYFLAQDIVRTNHIIQIPLEILNYIDRDTIQRVSPDDTTYGEQDGSSSGSTRPNRIIIVLDAGHGGKDPGAVANEGTDDEWYEKDIALDIVTFLKPELEQYSRRYRVILTRSDDTFLELEERVAYAQEVIGSGYGIFVSIHVNKTFSSEIQGIETYYYSYLPSDEDYPDILSQRHQYIQDSYLEGVNAQTAVRDVLTYMIENDLSHTSQMLAQSINGELYEEVATYTENRGIKRAHYAVIARTSIPSALVEVGFISNKEERERLITTSYQKKIAKGIAQGIHRFLENFSP